MIADVIGDFTNAEEINRWAGVLLGMVPGVTDKAGFLIYLFDILFKFSLI
jgi:hypothetical protein